MIFKRKGIALIFEQLAKTIASLLFFPRLFISENFKDYIRKESTKSKNKDIIILANGPSLKNTIKEIVNNLEEYKNATFFAINDFATANEYKTIRPSLYALSDSKYFIDTIYKEKCENTLRLIDKNTEWPLCLYVPYKYYKSFLAKKCIKNPLIKIIPFHSVRFWGLNKIRMYVYKKGWGNGEFGTVVINAIYIAIVLGYKELYLYGIDHNFFDGLHVTNENVLCYMDTHFYDDKKVNLKPMISHHNGIVEPFTMQDFLVEKLDVFTGHFIMNEFAKYMGCKIYNSTLNSMVDTYTRKEYHK